MAIANSGRYDDIGVVVAMLSSTSGYGDSQYDICPVCGRPHTGGNGLCSDCEDDFFENTLFGRVVKGKAVTYKGKTVPSSVMRGGKPTPAFDAYVALNRICRSSFSL